MSYTPKTWASNELITTSAMNNIEIGIQEALAQTTSIQQTATTAINQVTSIRDQIVAEMNNTRTELDSFQTDVMSNVDSALTNNSNYILELFRKTLGADYYNVNSLSWLLPNDKQTVNERLVELYTEVFGDSGASASNESLRTRVQTLETNLSALSNNTSTDISTLYTRIKTALGSSYYPIDTANWTLDNAHQSVNTRLEELHDAIFGDSQSGAATSLIDQLAELNTAIFGSASGGEASGSLIDKIKAALGRPIDLIPADLENNIPAETADAETGEYSRSIMTLIRQLQGVLGIEGGDASGASSNLV